MEIVKKNEFKYDPNKLPPALDFNLTARKLGLPESIRKKIQVGISKMSGKQLKDTIEYLGDMRVDALRARRYKLGAYCQAVKEYIEAYFKSTKAQNRAGDKY